MLGLGRLEPLADTICGVTAMLVEHAVHLRARGDALEDLAD
ncbi:hypothetical protein ACMYR2_1193 [Nitrobacter sp. TKz-YC01]